MAQLRVVSKCFCIGAWLQPSALAPHEQRASTLLAQIVAVTGGASSSVAERVGERVEKVAAAAGLKVLRADGGTEPELPMRSPGPQRYSRAVLAAQLRQQNRPLQLRKRTWRF